MFQTLSESISSGTADLHRKDFGWALSMMRNCKGRRMYRESWNGKGQYVFYQEGYPDGIPLNKNTSAAAGIPEGTICRFRPYLMIYTSQGDFAPWVPSIGDILAYDWNIIEEFNDENETDQCLPPAGPDDELRQKE